MSYRTRYLLLVLAAVLWLSFVVFVLSGCISAQRRVQQNPDVTGHGNIVISNALQPAGWGLLPVVAFVIWKLRRRTAAVDRLVYAIEDTNSEAVKHFVRGFEPDGAEMEIRKRVKRLNKFRPHLGPTLPPAGFIREST